MPCTHPCYLFMFKVIEKALNDRTISQNFQNEESKCFMIPKKYSQRTIWGIKKIQITWKLEKYPSLQTILLCLAKTDSFS